MPLDQCLECGFEFGDRRALTVARFRDFPARLGEMLEAADEGMLRRRPSAGVWSPIEYAAHVGEALGWYVARVRRVLCEDAPQLEPFDFDVAAEAGNYNRRDIRTVLIASRNPSRQLAEIARQATGIQLSRYGLGSDGSPRSVESLLDRAAHEVAHHDLDLRRGLGLAPEQ